MSGSPIIEIKQVNKKFGEKTILQDLNLQIEEGKFYSLVGESGSGKTTTLRLMNGLERPSEGQVFYSGRPLDYSDIIPVRRSMGYCLQGYTLFPHMSVRENITLVAKKAGWNSTRRKQRLDEVMELLGLDPDQYLRKMPNQLSGGQKQRVGIARAIFMNPKVLLMDEPFGALDPITRNELQQAFIELQKKLNLSVVLVTHDLSEAFKMSHQIMVLNNGKLVQQGKPNSLLTRPADEYVESFLKSNSPGHILREVPVYSVLYSDVWVERVQDSGFSLRNCDTGEMKSFKDAEQVAKFLSEAEQRLSVQVDGNEQFVSAKELSSGIEILKTIDSTSDLLEALQQLFHMRTNSLPVIGSDGKVMGIFGREALDVVG